MFILYILLGFIALPIVFIAFFAIGSLFYKNPVYENMLATNKIAVYIPAYKEDAVVIDSVKNVLKQKYHLIGKQQYDIIVIAQHLKDETINVLKQLNCIVLEYNVEKSTKVKALQYAIDELSIASSDYQLHLILDADNHLQHDFLQKINNAFAAGHTAIQGHRSAKNLNTRFAYLDAIAEEMNNSIFRKGFNFWNLSSSIIGSGIALSKNLFIERINASTAIAGFDKEMANELTRSSHYILYLNDAILYDEKVQNQAVFEKQRTRWIDAQIQFAKKYTGPAITASIQNGNGDFLMKALENLLPPRIILLGTLFLLTVIALFIGDSVFMISLSLSILYVGSLCIAIPAKLWTYQLFDALIKLPNAFLSMIRGWLKIKSSKKEFIHTPHGLK